MHVLFDSGRQWNYNERISVVSVTSCSSIPLDLPAGKTLVPDSSQNLTVAAHVPLSERPLVADDENTVISVPGQARPESAPVRPESVTAGDDLRQRLFPVAGSANGAEAGIRLAHFEIRSRLGAGGMGAVFKAVDLELSRDVALKILHPSSSQDLSLVARFRNEARACAQLNHDNIARVFYAGSQDGLFFIAYEFADGQTIRDLILDRGRLSIEETVNYAIQVTLALNHISSAGIVHRDIKPSNIMLTETGRVKVVDLGLARRDTTDSIGDITVAGTTLGTFDYISPEQARDPRNADVRSDIYSLGCTMYHMLTGQPPYPEGTALQKLLDHQGKSPPDPKVLNSRIPNELQAIMRKMMSNNPAHRYQSPGLLLNDLIVMAGIIGLHSVPAEGIVWRRPGRGEGRHSAGALWVFASVLILCLTALFIQRGGGESTNAGLVHDAEPPGKEVDPALYLQPPGPGFSEKSATATTKTVTNAGSESIPPTADFSGEQPKGNPGPIVFDFPGPNPAMSPIGPLASSVYGILAALPDRPASDAESTGPFQLQSSSGVVQSFRTLKAAVAEARSGDVVLLRFNGYPDDIPAQPSVRIVGLNLIIRAAEGFRPTLEFDGATEGTVSPGYMFSLQSQGALTIQGIDLRLIVSDDLNADRWSLFHCEGANRISLENVSLDFRNPDSQPAAVFDFTEEGGGTVDAIARSESEIALKRVICRANADFFRIACQFRGRIGLADCGLALNGSLLRLRGDNSMQPGRGSLEMTLGHVTCLHSAPLIFTAETDGRSTGSGRRTLPRVTFRSEACVFSGVGAEPHLLQSQSSEWPEDIESLIAWNGFTNLYEGHVVFWHIESSEMDGSRRLDFEQWKQLWQNRADSEDTNSESRPQLQWQNPVWRNSDSTLSPAVLTPASLELNPGMFNEGPASLPRARDGLMPGVNPQELPPFPRSTNTASRNPDAAPDSVVTPAPARD